LGGFNLYGYLSNDGINFTDYLGREKQGGITPFIPDLPQRLPSSDWGYWSDPLKPGNSTWISKPDCNKPWSKYGNIPFSNRVPMFSDMKTAEGHPRFKSIFMTVWDGTDKDLREAKKIYKSKWGKYPSSTTPHHERIYRQVMPDGRVRYILKMVFVPTDLNKIAHSGPASAAKYGLKNGRFVKFSGELSSGGKVIGKGLVLLGTGATILCSDFVSPPSLGNTPPDPFYAEYNNTYPQPYHLSSYYLKKVPDGFFNYKEEWFFDAEIAQAAIIHQRESYEKRIEVLEGLILQLSQFPDLEESFTNGTGKTLQDIKNELELIKSPK